MDDSKDRSALRGLEERVFKLVSEKATSVQWAEWLRAPLEHALAEGDKDLAVSLLKAGADGGAGWKGCDGRTLLDAAAGGGDDEMVLTLLDAGGRADVDAVSGSKKMTALHRACEGGHRAAAQALLAEGADVGLVDSDGCGALHYALRGGHEELARCVIAAGADLNAKDIDGDTPLHLAASEGLSGFVRMFLRRGVEVDVINGSGKSALLAAVTFDSINSAEALLKAGADPNLRSNGGDLVGVFSPLYLARENVALTKLLLKHGADLKSTDSLGFTALHWAAEEGSTSVIDALVEAGADIEARSSAILFNDFYDFEGSTPLHGAAKVSNLQNMAALLHKGANIDARDADGLTPLHVVCSTASEDPFWAHRTADFLLRRGADETITDNDGHTPDDRIDSSAATASLQRLLASAPADRAWRRRGMLVLCRARLAKVPGGVGDGRARKVSRQGNGVRADAGGSGGGEGDGCVVTRVVGLEADGVFRAIVSYL